MSARRPYALSAGMVLVVVLATALVVGLPFLRFAYRAPALHVVVETVNAVVALVVAYLVVGRFRSARRRQELLLVLALTTVAVANLVLTALPTALGDDVDLSRWAPLAVRLAGTLLFAAAALTPPTVLVRDGGTRRAVLVAGSLVVALVVAGVLLGERLPPPVDPALVPDDASRPSLSGHPLALGVQVLSGVLYAVAAVAFTRQAARTGDELLRWVGAGCVLAAGARVHYLLFPSLYSDYVYSGDALRLAFYLLLLVGAAREVGSYWQARTQAAVLEDRRRLARDLHDGLTQELTYIYSQTRHLAAHPDDAQAVQRVNDAAARAIDEARTAIAALTRSDRPCFAEVLRQTVESLASRYDVQASVDASRDVVLPAPQADAVLRIVGEAFRNGVRHGRASTVSVTLGQDPLKLVVEDDGQGFDPSTSNSTGFGMTSMRERAEGLGARLVVDGKRGRGTRVEVVWP